MKNVRLVSTLLCGLAAAAQAQELNLKNWGNYNSPELLKKITAETGLT